MKAWLFFFALTLLSAEWLSAEQPDKQPTFVEIVEANFKKWDANGDGKLTPQEINALLLNPTIAGNEAAAVAVLHRFYLSAGNHSPVRDLLTKPVLLEGKAKFKKKDKGKAETGRKKQQLSAKIKQGKQRPKQVP